MHSHYSYRSQAARRRSDSGRGTTFAALVSIIVAAAALMLPSVTAAQTPGTLDATFALGNGKIPAIPMGTGAARVQSVTTQPDGKIVLFGYCSNGTNNDFCVARLHADGNIDTTFVGPNGTSNGKVILPMGAGEDLGQAVAVQPDGKIVLFGYCSNGADNDYCFARLLPNGALDPTFVGPSGNAGGKFLVPIGASEDFARALLLQPDGKIVGSGYCASPSTATDFCLARLNPDGSLDTGFDGPSGNGDGKVIFNVGLGLVADFAHGSALQPDGKVILVGACTVAGQNDFCAARLNTDGTLDTSFNGTGKVSFPVGPAGDGAISAVVQPDGKIIMAGNCSNGTNFDFCIARLNPDGSLDATFDGPSGTGGGKFLLPIGAGDDAATAVRLTADGKILLAGTCIGDFCTARLNADGTLDTTYDGPTGTGDGKVIYQIGPTNDTLFSAALLPDGKVVLAGACNDSVPTQNFCVARVNGGPFNYRACSPDVDGDNQVFATIDGLILSRVALGIRGSAVINGISFPANATRNTWPLIRDYLFSHCGMSVY